MSQGCVYVIEAEGLGLYKIGATGGGVERRRSQLLLASPVPLTVICEIAERRHYVLEAFIHRAFTVQRSHRVRGRFPCP